MKVQVNTKLKLEIGEKVDIRGTGFYLAGTEDPDLDAVRRIYKDGYYIGGLPTADDTLEHLSSCKDLLDAEPRLKNENEIISGVVVSKEPSAYYNIYSVEVVTSAEATR